MSGKKTLSDCDCGQDFCDFDCNECPRQAFISKDCSKARYIILIVYALFEICI